MQKTPKIEQPAQATQAGLLPWPHETDEPLVALGTTDETLEPGWTPDQKPEDQISACVTTADELRQTPRYECTILRCPPIEFPAAIRPRYFTNSYANGDFYLGEIGANYQRHGQGICQYANGDKYDGMWIFGLRTGHGVYSFACGDSYEGAWEAGKRHGLGMFTYKSGDRLSGMWHEDHPDGWIVMHFVRTNQHAVMFFA